MIACEIQLQHVIRDKIRDKIQSETKFSPRQNSVREKVREKDILSGKKNCQKKIGLGRCLGFPVCEVSCLGEIDAYHHEAVCTHRSKHPHLFRTKKIYYVMN